MTTDNNDHVTATALRAIAVAQTRFHDTVTLEHVLSALLERAEVQKCLSDLNIDHAAVRDELNSFLDSVDAPKAISAMPGRTREFDVVFARTIAYSQFSARRFPTGLDILFQILMFFEDGFASSTLRKFGLDHNKLRQYMAQGVRQPHNEYSSETEPTDKTQAIVYIKKYCINLNEQAELGKIDPVVGRLSELERVIQVIARRTKNNVVLVGNAGVGKTAIIEGLACNITKGYVPQIFRNSTVWSLDVGSLVAGTRFRGDFEERMKFLLKSFALIEDDEPILFIDEIHMIMDAGSGNKGSMDISNLIKPALARGRLRCIGSTTDRDWRQHFEKDRALLRRFKKILINEPSIEDSKLILHGVRNAYQSFHNVRYTDGALDAAVVLTAKYVSGALPDKAIDVIDEAGARQRVIDDQPTQVVDVEAIEQEISLIAKIPVRLLKTDEAIRLLDLEKDLKAAIFGQDQAISHLVRSVLISRSGLQEVNKPEGSYLFIGPTGVGKSEMVKQLAAVLGLPLTKLDMSEYTEKHSISKLIGSPPGYVGFGDGGAGNGLLINAIDSAPASILLLDEIEKAHPDVYDILLQVMEDAVMTNSEGKTVSFRNVILIMTSNVGTSKMERNGMGFLQVPIEIDENLLKATFSAEFRNRLDAIVEFGALDKPSMGRIVQKFIAQIQDSVRDRDIIIEMTDAAKKWLTDKGFDAIHGARPLKRVIAETIKQPLSRLILFGALRYGGVARISVEDHDLVVNGTGA